MTLEILKDRLQQYLTAEAAILRGQEYTIGDRRLRRADLSQVQKMITDLQSEIAEVEGSKRRVKRIVFYD